MNNKKYILIAILALAIGFATVSTVLYINGLATIAINQEGFDKNVIFSEATTDEGGKALIEQEGKVVTFTSKTLQQLNDVATLNFTISNLDKNYDAEATIVCKFIDEELHESDTNELLTKTITPETYTIASGGTASGVLTTTLKHNPDTAVDVSIKCTINATAKERGSAGNVPTTPTGSFSGEITDKDGNKLTSGYVAVYSDTMKVVEIDENSMINVTGLEHGTHEMYYMGSTNPTGMKKSEVISSALASGTFTTTMTVGTIKLKKGEVEYYVTKSYTVTFEITNGTTSVEILKVPYNGTNTVTITPSGYIESVSCTNGYTTTAVVGEDETAEQTITISNNGKSINSVCTINIVKAGIKLYNMMRDTASSETINFSVNSKTSGTNGIYKTTNTEGNVPVYYYRGAYDKVKNNLIFNNMCWKIIRTTETGGVKIIYNGTPTNGKCETQTGVSTQIGTKAFNTLYAYNAYVGYMYGAARSSTYEEAHTNTNESTIKSESIDPWFKTNFDAIAVSKLEDTIFCNDRSTKAYDANTIGFTSYSSYGDSGYSANATLYGAAHRASYLSNNPAPTLVCKNTNDKFTLKNTKTNYNSELNGNKTLDYPVGLITLDEVVFAGYNTNQSNTSDYQSTTNYLYTGQNYWTLSPVNKPASGNASVGAVANTGNIGGGSVHSVYGVRPVVSLNTGTKVLGEGSSTNPYVVQ